MEKQLIISMSFETDGDVHFKNETNYLNESFEYYSKKIICNQEDFFGEMSKLVYYLNENVYNRYNQHQWLVDFVKELTLSKIFKTESTSVEDYIDKYETLLSGNQYLNFSVTEFKSSNNEDKMKSFISLYEELKNTEQMKQFLLSIKEPI